MTGEAAPDSSVNITVDESVAAAVADSSGNWTFDPGDLTEGDHSITLENNGSTIKFTLTLGKDKVDWDAIEKGGDGTSLPTAGVTTPTILLLVLGAVMILGSGKIVNAKKR
jgi:hypothetical protein